MSKLIDEAGKRYGRLTVLRKYEDSGRWVCLCACGVQAVVKGSNLRAGMTVSCGCAQRNRGVQIHGHNRKTAPRSRSYTIWMAMRQRCCNPKNRHFYNYGGRGITHDPRWASFALFLEDMGEPPSLDLTLGRIDNDGLYTKVNCRWETRTQQQRNMRTNRLIEYRGVIQCLAAWAQQIGLSHNTLRARFRYGWTVERALTRPVA